jgi:hypothetical protein
MNMRIGYEQTIKRSVVKLAESFHRDYLLLWLWIVGAGGPFKADFGLGGIISQLLKVRPPTPVESRLVIKLDRTHIRNSNRNGCGSLG